MDVTILSPPHIALFIGIYAVLVGTAVLIAGHMNPRRRKGESPDPWIVSLPGRHHDGWGYGADYGTGHPAAPAQLHALHCHVDSGANHYGCRLRVTAAKFAATFVAGFYMLFLIACIQILPLFPAEPKLGPVYQHVTHFIPPQFPLLLIVPAFLLDLLWQRTKYWSTLATAAVSAALFVASLVAVEYPFASLLMSPASRNSFFGTSYLPFGAAPQSFLARHLFYLTDSGPQFFVGMLIAMILCTLTTWFGINRGDWLRQVQR